MYGKKPLCIICSYVPRYLCPISKGLCLNFTMPMSNDVSVISYDPIIYIFYPNFTTIKSNYCTIVIEIVSRDLEVS